MSVLDLDERTIRDFVSLMVHGSTPKGYVRTYAAGRVAVDNSARECYSYGRHFPLFRYIPRRYRTRDGFGRWTDRTRPAPLFVLNGDIWRNGGGPSRTASHQDIARRAVADTGVASLVLPFSALDGAGVDIDSIRPLDVQADTWTVETVTVAHLDDVPRWMRHEGSGALNSGTYRRTAAGYEWDENRHRLGEALFTAVRDVREPRRPARPCETERDTARDTVTLVRADGDDYCADSETRRHEAGPSGACVTCGEPLFADTVWHRRARYLSSFDYHEAPPLYFLCEVPRTGHPTVAGAIDSLAPRAVHAARLNGRDVRRQGDVFFIGTDQTTESLEQRGAVFGRLTQWTRDAKPRPGEIGYTAPDRARDRRRMQREADYRRQLWRDEWRALQSRATGRFATAETRDARRSEWETMRARHALADLPQWERDSETRRMRERFARATDAVGPKTPHGYRRRFRDVARARAEAVDVARAELRRATLAGIPPRYESLGGRIWRETATDYRLRRNRHAVQTARRKLERAIAETRELSETRPAYRDAYRQRFGANASALHVRCTADARLRFRPETVDGSEQHRRRREAVRRHLMVYGTSHSATEVARVGGAVYVRGTVRHAVDLELTRRGGPDHRPVTLAPGVWYLAVRNTVPRANRRRRPRKPVAA